MEIEMKKLALVAAWILVISHSNLAAANSKEEQLVAGFYMDIQFGDLIPGKKTESVKSLEKLKGLAEQGDAYAQAELGKVYEIGFKILPKDLNQAVKWYKKSAAQGNPAGEYYLARIYRFEPLKDAGHAIPLYEDSAGKGYGLADFDLAIVYEAGELVPKNNDKSFYWMQKAADAGVADGQAALALYFIMGKGTKTDNLLALKWAYIAQAGGNKQAKITVKRLEADNPPLIPDAQKLAQDWWEKHPKEKS